MTVHKAVLGRFFDDFEVGDTYQHPFGRTITETDNAWFTLLTCNTNQMHFNAHLSQQNPITEGKIIVVSGFTVGLVLGLVAGVAGTWAYARSARAKQMQDGQPRRVWPVGLGLIVGLPILIWAMLGAPFTPDIPALRGFNFQGGITVSPEYFALLLGLVMYTAAFIAEIVRAGITSVPQGQWEAAQALGLRPGMMLRRIILPQALRVIIPPMTSQYLNLTKNSSLAVAIGYQDIVSIANTTLNQTGQAIEGIAIIMLVYLTISLSISLFMNWYNTRIALVER